MAQLAIAWVLQNENVAAAIIGASRPEQVHANAAASGVVIPPELIERMDEVLADVVERDPRRTDSESANVR
jgi:aryl-alcohol dehydrogenase-like predicted oxidoreductase